ncbi:MAG: hypothetical protein HN942_07745 [Methylococcales bacterium]|jgi:hypothetical protein|nr:hypothetical protein [Methylococcales bacterium]MBT4348946.1 hypothetical protein [Methylococcales bacterium]MBT7108932.1 hypothetical protein [Methylococcales bacterium]MDP7561406.1 hypothetical protein [Methylococcales bacterium]
MKKEDRRNWFWQMVINFLIWVGITGAIGSLFVTLGIFMIGEYVTLLLSIPALIVSLLLYRWADARDLNTKRNSGS